MRVFEQERLQRYRKAYPDDCRPDKVILLELDRVRKDKKYLDRWIAKQVYQNGQEEKGE